MGEVATGNRYPNTTGPYFSHPFSAFSKVATLQKELDELTLALNLNYAKVPLKPLFSTGGNGQSSSGIPFVVCAVRQHQ